MKWSVIICDAIALKAGIKICIFEQKCPPWVGACLGHWTSLLLSNIQLEVINYRVQKRDCKGNLISERMTAPTESIHLKLLYFLAWIKLIFTLTIKPENLILLSANMARSLTLPLWPPTSKVKDFILMKYSFK